MEQVTKTVDDSGGKGDVDLKNDLDLRSVVVVAAVVEDKTEAAAADRA